MHVWLIYIVIFILFVSCQSQDRHSKNEFLIIHNTAPEAQEINSFETYFKLDSTIVKRDSVNKLTISNGLKTEEILSICNCEKNIRENTIKIQITAAIPTQSELDKGITDGRTFMGLGGIPDSLLAQLRFLTFHFKDNTVENIQLFYKATEQVYNNSDFKYSNISDYQIRSSKFDYSITSEVFGTFNVLLPEPFGYFKNDTLLTGTFECNNWRVNTFDAIENWDLNEWFKQNRGYIDSK